LAILINSFSALNYSNNTAIENQIRENWEGKQKRYREQREEEIMEKTCRIWKIEKHDLSQLNTLCSIALCNRDDAVVYNDR